MKKTTPYLKNITNKFSISKFSIGLSIFIFAIAITISGCSESITSSVKISDKYQARTEAELSISGAASVIPGAVVYVDLEHLNAPASGVNGDTGPIGEDVIPYSYTETATHRIKLGADAMFRAKLVSDAGTTIYELNNPGDTARVSIPAGNYKLFLTSLVTTDGAYGSTQPVFIQRDLDAINSGAGVQAQGGYNKDDLNQLLTTRKCIGCNLERVQIQDKDLSGVDISGAHFSHSSMMRVNLSHGIFANTDWTSAGANNCTFDSAKFTFTILNRTVFGGGSFIRAAFQRINWDQTGFPDADMRYVTFDSGAGSGNFDGADLRYATISNISGWRDMSFNPTKLTGATFSNVSMYNSFLGNSVVDSVQFINGCFFQLSTYRGNKMRYCTFTNFRGDGSVFDDSDMTGSTMTNYRISGGSMRACILINTIWNVADVTAVNMCHQDRTGAVFNNISYNVDTDCWP